MTEALARVRATGSDLPGLSADHLDNLQRSLEHWRDVAHRHPEYVDPVAQDPATRPG